MTTIEAARDMDVLRAALGEEQLTYLGASYGTKLGATYAELFPERVGRLVLDGAVDVSLSSRDLALGQAAGFQTALEAYVENCVEETEDCFLGDSVDEGLQRIRDFLDEVDAATAARPGPTVSSPRARALYGIITPLYVRDYWFLLSAALRQGFDGNGAALLQLADLYASRNADGTYSSNAMEAFYAISCLDDPFAIGVDEVEDQYPDFEAASPTLGRFFAWSLGRLRWLAGRLGPGAPRDRREGRRPDRGRRAPPATRPRRTTGRWASPTSSTPACSSPATGTGTPATTPATTASTRRSRTTWSRAPSPRTA